MPAPVTILAPSSARNCENPISLIQSARAVAAHYLHIEQEKVPEGPVGQALVVAIGSRIEAKERANRPIPGQDPVSWATERGTNPDALSILLRFVESDLQREAATLGRIRGSSQVSPSNESSVPDARAPAAMRSGS